MENSTADRFARQTTLKGIGHHGQQKLLSSRVLVVGAGGLGSPALYYLCAAGVGTLGIAEDDIVSGSNLNRQILYTANDLSHAKTSAAADRLRALHPAVRVQQYPRLTQKNAEEIISLYDVVVDCVDNYAARLLVARACHSLKKPLVEAGVEGFSGFVMSILPDTACFACLCESRQDTSSVPVLGSTCGVAGSLQAAECVKLLLGLGEPLLNRALFFDLLFHDYTILPVEKQPNCPVCGE